MDTLPIFPLNTVLFPGGVLPLRIFEARYMDMVRQCMKDQQRFGVCLITKGSEAGQPAEHEMIGCSAQIVDFDMQQQGILSIRTVGKQRFRINDKTTNAAGVIQAQVSWIPADTAMSMGAQSEFASCVTLLKRVDEDITSERGTSPFEQPHAFDEGGWVSNRLCEVLSISNKARQKLMELEDALTRMQIVRTYLQQHKIID